MPTRSHRESPPELLVENLHRRDLEVAIYEHPYLVRITHWVSALSVTVMIFSGLQIFRAFPSFGAKLPQQDDPSSGLARARGVAGRGPAMASHLHVAADRRGRRVYRLPVQLHEAEEASADTCGTRLGEKTVKTGIRSATLARIQTVDQTGVRRTSDQALSRGPAVSALTIAAA
jgi:hypothetical protein